MVDISEELRLIRDPGLSPQEQSMVEDLFKHYLTMFWEELREPVLLPELNELWFWIKMHMLSRLTNEGNTNARMMLEAELKLNAKKYENRRYDHRWVAWK